MNLFDRYGSLIVVGKFRIKAKKVTHVLVLCDCGALSEKDYTNVKNGLTTTCGNSRIHPKATNPRSDNPSYRGMHSRIARAHGRASLYECRDCGLTANEWSYEGGCPEERTERIRTHVLPYCTHARHYTPRCKPCHVRHDMKEKP